MERVWQREYANQMEAKTDVTAYIVGFYNCNRIHSVLGNLSPFVFEQNKAAKNLSLCPKLLDHYTPYQKYIVNLRIKALRWENRFRILE